MAKWTQLIGRKLDLGFSHDLFSRLLLRFDYFHGPAGGSSTPMALIFHHKINNINDKTFFKKALLGHDGQKRSDEKRSLCLTKENVGSGVQTLSSSRTQTHIQQPA